MEFPKVHKPVVSGLWPLLHCISPRKCPSGPLFPNHSWVWLLSGSEYTALFLLGLVSVIHRNCISQGFRELEPAEEIHKESYCKESAGPTGGGYARRIGDTERTFWKGASTHRHELKLTPTTRASSSSGQPSSGLLRAFHCQGQTNGLRQSIPQSQSVLDFSHMYDTPSQKCAGVGVANGTVAVTRPDLGSV